MAANEVGNRFQNLVLEDEANYQAAISAIFRAPFDAELYALYPSSNFAAQEFEPSYFRQIRADSPNLAVYSLDIPYEND